MMTFEDIFNTIDRATASAPVNLERLCRALGIKLEKGYLDPAIVGQLERNSDDSYTITYNELNSSSGYRRRFTIAHEIGHYVLHKHLIGDGVDDNKAFRSENVGQYFNCNIKPHHEAEANRFAAALLMPKDLIRTDYPYLEVSEMCEKYQVSEQAMLIRLKTLGLVPREELKKL